MPRYQYIAVDARGERVSSTVEASSLPALCAKVEATGARVESARSAVGKIPRVRGVPFFEIVALYRQIASSIQAGLPLHDALGMLSNESRDPRLKSLLFYLRTQIADGVSFSDSMKLFPNVFPSVHVSAVRAGEESGRLEETLEQLATQSEIFSNMNRRFASSLVYPTVVAVVALGLFNFGFMSIVPKFRALFGDLGIVDYPSFTNIIFFLSATVLPIVTLTIIGILILVGMITLQRKASSGRLWVDAWKLKVPGFGQVIEKTSLARFTGMLGVLLESGVELPRAVRLAAEGAGNQTVEHLLKNVSSEIEKGQSLSEALSKSDVLPSSLAWRMGVGEETGTLPDALVRVSKLYADQVDSLVTSLAGMLEPTLIIVIGSGVAMLVLGMFLPVVSVIQNLSGG